MKQTNKIELAFEEEDQKPMMVHCSKCNKLFDRKTKYTKICEDCWNNTKRGDSIGFRGYGSCDLCGGVIFNNEKKITVTSQGEYGLIIKFKRECKNIGSYHLSCWNSMIQKKIDSITKKNKLLTETNRILVAKQMLA